MAFQLERSAASLILVGSIAYDTITTPKAPAQRGLGGSAIFFAAAASFLSRPEIIAVVGDNFDFSELDFLRERGLDLSSIEQRQGQTFEWGGIYGEDYGDVETTHTILNVFADFQPTLKPSQVGTDFLFLGNIMPSLQLDVLKQAKAHFAAVDTMNLWINTARDELLEVLKRIQLVVVNETEARLLSGRKGILEASKAIQKMGPETVVVKRGSRGAFMLHGDREFLCPATLDAPVVDPTGCGDSFGGGLIGTLARLGRVDFEALKEGVVLGSIMAAKTLGQFSVQGLRQAKLDELLEEYQVFREQLKVPALGQP